MLKLVALIGISLPISNAACVLNTKFCDPSNGTARDGYTFVNTSLLMTSTQCQWTSGTLMSFDCASGYVRDPDPPVGFTRNILCASGEWIGHPTISPADEGWLTCAPAPTCPFLCEPNATVCKGGATSGTIPLGSTAGCADGYFPTTVPICTSRDTKVTYRCTNNPLEIESSAAWLNYISAVAAASPRAIAFSFTPDVCNSGCTPTAAPTSACGGKPYACSPCLNCSLSEQTTIDFGSVTVRSSAPWTPIDPDAASSRPAARERAADAAVMAARNHAGLMRGMEWSAAVRDGSSHQRAARQTLSQLQHQYNVQHTVETRVVQVVCVGDEARQRDCLKAAACDGLIVAQSYCVVLGAIVSCPKCPQGSKKGFLGLLGLIGLVPLALCCLVVAAFVLLRRKKIKGLPILVGEGVQVDSLVPPMPPVGATVSTIAGPFLAYSYADFASPGAVSLVPAPPPPFPFPAHGPLSPPLPHIQTPQYQQQSGNYSHQQQGGPPPGQQHQQQLPPQQPHQQWGHGPPQI